MLIKSAISSDKIPQEIFLRGLFKTLCESSKWAKKQCQHIRASTHTFYMSQTKTLERHITAERVN